jgi:GTPase SAR1 family protein
VGRLSQEILISPNFCLAACVLFSSNSFFAYSAMGGVCSSDTVVIGPTDRETEKIDRMLEEQKRRENLHFKILILGAGESGKSTIVKQLTFIHKQTVTKDEKQSYVKVLQNNTLQCMVTLIKEAEGFGYDFTGKERVAADAICSQDQRTPMPPEVCDHIELLWNCAAVQKTYDRRHEFWHLEATEYYFKNAMRFVEEGYLPTEEDIVMARKRTTGVVVTELDYGQVHWSVVDVGGQRSERRKWLNCRETHTTHPIPLSSSPRSFTN